MISKSNLKTNILQRFYTVINNNEDFDNLEIQWFIYKLTFFLKIFIFIHGINGITHFHIQNQWICIVLFSIFVMKLEHVFIKLLIFCKSIQYTWLLSMMKLFYSFKVKLSKLWLTVYQFHIRHTYEIILLKTWL